jgi:hypothetical protein
MAVFRVEAAIALIMEAARTSETLVNFYQTTQRYNPEDSHLHLEDVFGKTTQHGTTKYGRSGNSTRLDVDLDVA